MMFPQGMSANFPITATGIPLPAFRQSGRLPGGVKFVDNGDGTASLYGRPGNGLGQVGDYFLTLTASNGVAPAATQNFKLTITRPPVITSVNNATFVVGASNTFTVGTKTSRLTVNLSFTGALPAGVTFVANTNGTATLSGTPPPGSEGPYPITITASNGTLPNAKQTFTLTVQDAPPVLKAPAITSSASTTFTVGTEGIFTARTTGTPTSSLTLTGTQPSWLSFIDNTDGTATFVGAPDPGSAGNYTFTITATNGVVPDATQTFTLVVVDTSPVITSVNNATFIASAFNTFTVKTKTSVPSATLSFTGTLPAGVTFVANTNGTATLSGTPPPGSERPYQIMITAANGTLPNATQIFVITVQDAPPVLQAPAITSAAGTTFTVGAPGTFAVTATGTPTSSLTLVGPRPSWLLFVDHTDGTATMSGTPDLNSDASYAFTITARNGVSPSATQTFILTVLQAPAITSPSSVTFTVGAPASFNVTTRGNPAAILTLTGALPSGITFTDTGNGGATLAGTPAAGTRGSYVITITAANGVTSNGTQSFTLTVIDQRSQLLNLSSRLQVRTGANVLIGGFIITGNTAKKVMIRGLGPSLSNLFGTSALHDSTLELHQGSLVETNDDWQTDANVGQIPNGFQPSDPRESVLVRTLTPGSYTVILAGKNGTTGVGLVELYDLDAAANSQLAELSARAFVQGGNNVLIGGFIIGANTSSNNVIVRALGPSLAQAQIANPLADPTLELHDANGARITSNDNWQDDPTQAAQVIAAGIAPSNRLESAIAASLSPGAYTAIVAGKNAGTGVGLIEIYNVQ